MVIKYTTVRIAREGDEQVTEIGQAYKISVKPRGTYFPKSFTKIRYFEGFIEVTAPTWYINTAQILSIQGVNFIKEEEIENFDASAKN